METINNVVVNNQNIVDTQKYILDGGSKQEEKREISEIDEMSMMTVDDQEIFFDDEFNFDEIDTIESPDKAIKILGPAYDVEVEVVKKTWNIVYDSEDVRRDLKDQFEDELLQETGKETLSIKNQHLVLDKVDNLVEFVNSYDHNHNTLGKKMSITGKI